jgi:hypothetical protein
MGFAKVLGGIKSFASNAADKIKQGAIKHGPTILDVASKAAKVGGFLGVPGASMIGEGLDVAKDLVKGVPNDEAKQKLDSFISESKKMGTENSDGVAPKIVHFMRSGAKYMRKGYGGKTSNKISNTIPGSLVKNIM